MPELTKEFFAARAGQIFSAALGDEQTLDLELAYLRDGRAGWLRPGPVDGGANPDGYAAALLLPRNLIDTAEMYPVPPRPETQGRQSYAQPIQMQRYPTQKDAAKAHNSEIPCRYFFPMVP